MNMTESVRQGYIRVCLSTRLRKHLSSRSEFCVQRIPLEKYPEENGPGYLRISLEYDGFCKGAFIGRRANPRDSSGIRKNRTKQDVKRGGGRSKIEKL